MATRTSIGSGLWSQAGTWDTGVPLDNDIVVIAAGHVVEFDVDQSGFANGIDGITVTGTLSLSRTAGTYQLKIMAAKAIGGAGTFDCGTLASPIPFAAKHTITGGTGWQITGAAGLTMTVYAAEPVIKYVSLTGAEAIGQTVLEVDTDVTGDIWAVGDAVKIIDTFASEVEDRVIAAAGIAAGSITITAGLTAAKSVGGIVVLISRNVRFIPVGTGAYYPIISFASPKLVIAGGYFYGPSNTLFRSCTNLDFAGGIVFGTSAFDWTDTGLTVSGGVTCASSAFNGLSNIRFTGGIHCGAQTLNSSPHGAQYEGGLFICNRWVIYNGSGVSVSGGIYTRNFYAINAVSAFVVSGGTFIDNYVAIISSSGNIKTASFSGSIASDLNVVGFSAFNTLFGSATENAFYTSLSKQVYSESIDHDQVAGAFKAWTRGGVTSSNLVTVPGGYSKAMQTVLENAAIEGFWQKEILVAAGASVEIEMWLQKDAAMSYLPRCLVFNKALTDPFGGGGTLDSFTMTNSVDTWESDTFTFTNTGTEDVTLMIRFQGMNANGNLYSALRVNVINVDLTSALALLGAIKAKTDNLPADPADESNMQAGFALIPPAPTAAQIRAEMDANSAMLAAILEGTSSSGTAMGESILEGEITINQALRVMLAAVAGKASGGGTTTIKYRDQADKKNRITATVDENGNRSKVVLDGH